MKKTLTFTIKIAAPRAVVWDTMIDLETYKQWTAVFCEGTYFTGSWEQDSKICFVGPNGDGMVSEIVSNKRHELISIWHLGEIKDGVEDTSSDAVPEWAPSFVNYQFAESNGTTELTVEVETIADYEKYMNEIFPKALASLKELCESH